MNDTKTNRWSDRFELAAGSVEGRAHRQAGRNNQDAYAIVREPEAVLAVVCDGCSSGRASEVGAQLGARLVGEALRRRLARLDEGPEVWEEVRQEVLGELRRLVLALGGEPERTVLDYFLFTVVGAVVGRETTWLLSLGDGVAFVNGARLALPRFESNAPDYLGYGLLQTPGPAFRVEAKLPTDELDSLLLATDGAEDLLSTLAPPEQFWTADRTFHKPDFLRRQLTLAARDTVRPGREAGTLEKTAGRLPDDTTLVVLRRRSPEGAERS